MNTLLLVDGSSYLYRAYHALPDLRGPGQVPTGAIHGMVAMLRRLREQYPASHAACVFDASGPTFRDAWYPAYKANRSAMPDDLRLQIEPIHEAVRLLGWPVLSVAGVEADDVIGTLAREAVARGNEVIISSGDKDLSQLVNDRVVVIDTMNNKRRDVAGVMAEFGVPPERIVDYLTLVGDTVDNVPGVEKVGPKTAAKWLAEYETLDALVARAAEVKGVAGENLRKALDFLPLGRKLVTIDTAVAGLPSFDDLHLGAESQDGLADFYKRFGFRTWLKELTGEELAVATRTAATTALSPGGDLFAEANPAAAPMPAAEQHPKQYDTITNLATLEAWVVQLKAAPMVALDTETTSLDAMQARIVGISFSVHPWRAAYVPTGHDYPGAPEQLPLGEVLACLRPWLEDPACPKVGQHIKYDLQVFANHGLAVQGYAHDTMLQSYVLEAHLNHSLDKLAQRHLGRQGISYEDVAGKGASQIPFSQVSVERATEYSCEDSDMTLAVHQTLWPRLAAEPALLRVYESIEVPTSLVLQRMERNGVLIDSALLAQQSQELGEKMVALEAEAHALAGQPFNLGSPKQIGEILFGKLGLPVVKKTATGAPSTDEEVLEKLAEDYPLPAKLLEYRSASKLKSTYTDKLPLMVNPSTGRVHTNYAQAVAVTGRLSSNDPNLQNIPIRTAEGRRVREAFIAPPGHVIASADYSQIELRIMAHISGDATLLKAFADGLDVHRATAAEVFGGTPDTVSAEHRRYAKVINFGLIYGMSAFGLASNLGIERSAAAAYIDKYFQRYPDVKRYMDETKASAKEKGYVETVFGRRLWLPEINGGNGPRRAGAERAAINAPMQGTAADLIKLSMVAMQRTLDEQGKRTKMIMQVHDELVFEVPDDEVDWVREEVPRVMAGVAQLRVPLVAEVGFGPNWERAH
jgi:DNA polymerase-1